MNSLKIKKNDTVVVLSGKDKGKQGKVLGTVPSERQGRRGRRATWSPATSSPARQGEEGGIIKREAAIYASKVQVRLPQVQQGYPRWPTEINGATRRSACASTAAPSFKKGEYENGTSES